MRIKEIQQAIECWTYRPTWHTSHSIDVEAMKGAISNIQDLSFTPSREELAEAIYESVKDVPSILGAPKDLRETAKEFATKIASRI